MPRVRFALPEAGAAAAAPTQQQPGAEDEDAWGESDDDETQDLPTLVPTPAHNHRQRPRSSTQHAPPPPQQQQQPQHQQHHSPQHTQPSSLQLVCMGVLGRHVTELVEQLQGQLQWLPADVKAALLAVGRRRGEVTGTMLASLADESWSQLDVSGCSRICGAELLAAAPSMPHITALDVTGVSWLSAGDWRNLAAAWPRLAYVRLGGGQGCSEEAFKALHLILPGISQPAAAAAPAVADSWEDAASSDDGEQQQQQQQQQQDAPGRGSSSGSTDGSASSSSSSQLRQLQALIWPDAPPEAVELVQRRCPRVLINPPPLKADPLTGQLPPRQLNPAVALDEPCMALVDVAGALQGARDAAAGSDAAARVARSAQPQSEHIADRFVAAYMARHRRLQAVEAKLAAAEERRALRSSHALRTLHAWYDRSD